MSPSPSSCRPAAAPAATTLPDGTALRSAWHRRIRPLDEAERTALDGMVGAVVRRALLDALEEKILRALLAGEPVEGLPSLATLCRCRARLEKDRAAADRDLRDLRRLRPFLADRAGPARPAAAGGGAHAAPEPRPGASPPVWPVRPRAVEEARARLGRVPGMRHADPERRPDWLASSSRYALEAGLLAAGLG